MCGVEFKIVIGRIAEDFLAADAGQLSIGVESKLSIACVSLRSIASLQDEQSVALQGKAQGARAGGTAPLAKLGRRARELGLRCRFAEDCYRRCAKLVPSRDPRSSEPVPKTSPARP